MQEPILVDEGDVWFYQIKGFACINGGKLKYLYCEPNVRNKGIGGDLLREIDEYCSSEKVQLLTALIPIDKKPFYLKKGWKIESELTNYLKISKTYAGTNK